jgi:GT2 family glycosyltransferase
MSTGIGEVGAASVAVVVCTRNNRDIIEETLSAIAAQTVGRPQCTVVDGRSTDGTVEFIRARFPWVEVIVKDSDSGPAASRNIGIFAAKTPLVALVDSDVRLRPDWLERQLQYLAANPTVAIVGGLLVYAHDESTIDAAYGALNRLGIAWDEGRGEPVGSIAAPRRCVWVTTSAMVLRRAMALEIGGFDDRLFACNEDVDLGWRANLAGYGVACNPVAVAVHRPHSTINRSSMRARLTYLLWRNRFRSTLVNSEGCNVMSRVGALLALQLPAIVFQTERRATFSALVWNLRFISDTLSRRRTVQSVRRIPDRTLDALLDKRLRGPGWD